MRMENVANIEILFKRHYVSMYRLATRMLRDDDAARDIVHDVFDSLLHNGPADVPLSYLLRSVRNRCINYRRNLTLHVK